jgi:hypothetical protein
VAAGRPEAGAREGPRQESEIYRGFVFAEGTNAEARRARGQEAKRPERAAGRGE